MATATTQPGWEVVVRIYVGNNLTGVLDEKPRFYEAFVAGPRTNDVAHALSELPELVRKYVGK